MTTSQQITRVRCTWAANELNIPYHDEEWGVPAHDERKWFEFLILERGAGGIELGHNPEETRAVSRGV